jgi:putative transposase
MLAEAGARAPIRVVASCLRPDHSQPAPWPRGDGDPSRWIHRPLTTHVRRSPRHSRRGGHAWQGRFGASPIGDDDYLRVVLRSIFLPLRSGMRIGVFDRQPFGDGGGVEILIR